jgi:hypothetical protein
MIRGSSVESLLEKVRRLPPAELGEFAMRFTAMQQDRGGASDRALREAACARLPAADDRRLRRLIAASERGTLTPEQSREYRALARAAERLDLVRLQALTELARRSSKPLRKVVVEVCEGNADGT